MSLEDNGTENEKIIVYIDEELEDLIPGFLNNRRKDIDQIITALENEDFELIRMLGHSMKGAGGGYGFDAITDIGSSLETAAKEKNREKIQTHVNTLSYYLDHVEVSYEQAD